MKISQAKATEYGIVQEFYHELIPQMQAYPYYPTWIVGVYPDDDYLKTLTENGQVFLGLENGRAIGVVVLNHQPNEGYEDVPWQVSAGDDEVVILHLLGVLPEYWGKGFSDELLDFAAELSRSQGQKAIRLDVMEANLPAKKLYERNGYREIETIEMYYESTGRTGFTMYEKDLG